MTETTERFFCEISKRIGYDEVAELYLFPVIRQSGVEAAMAVVAAYPDPAAVDNPGSLSSSHSHAHANRHVVYSARYRNTVKGTERGKWVVDVTAEADAPLLTIEEVVRGVVRRSGDAFHPEHITGDQFRAIVPTPVAPVSEPA